MREILFKAKRLDGEWVEGYPVYDRADCTLKRRGKCQCIHDGSLIAFFGWIDNLHEYDEVEVNPFTVCQYTNIDTREECGEHFESKKIFTGDVLGEWTEDEDGNEYIGFFGIVTYWEDEGRYVLADENGLCNDWTLEDVAQPENWPNLIHCGSIHDGEGDYVQRG